MREPSVNETAFCCPHCGAYTTQHWHEGYVIYIGADNRTPFIPNLTNETFVKNSQDIEKEEKAEILKTIRKLRSKLLFTKGKTELEHVNKLHNLNISECFNCKKWAVWVNEDLIYPPKKFGALPNQDIPEDILVVVDEARSILDQSPKGAAALLRLAIQLLCRFLGEAGDDLNSDIASLVKKGLSVKVQKSLDIVRVIGNEAVHPGVIDLDDNKDIAVQLFDLINIITEQMITQHKHVDELYDKLPEAKRKAIEKRDKK